MPTSGNKVDATTIRPRSLTVLCVLSFIAGIVFLFGRFSSYFAYGEMNALNEQAFIVMAVFDLGMLAGVLLMWRLNKTGFYIYTAFQLISLIYPFITNTGDTVMGILTLPIFVCSILFIVFYAYHLKLMR